MPSSLQLQIPPPNNWQDFEDLCADLWSKIWNDVNTQKNGRSGQVQHGVDVYGRLSGGGWQAVQCKGKESRYGKAVSEKELKSEVEKAKKFKPSIECFTLATTAPNDAKIQEVARLLTEENEKLGLFRVQVYGWEEILRRLFGYQEIFTKYYPGQGLLQHKIKKDLDALLEMQLTSNQNLQRLPNETADIVIQKLTETGIFPVTTDEKIDPEDLAINKEIDSYRDLIKDKPITALNLFQELQDRCWEDASNKVRFRITTNIGAAHFKLGNNKEASIFFIKAEQISPNNDKAISNLAIAYILMGNPERAKIEAKRCIQMNHSNHQGYALLIAAHSFDEEENNIESLVSSEFTRIPEVAYAIGNSYSRKGEHKKAKEWFEIAYASDHQSREFQVSYSTEILSAILTNPEVSHGNQINENQEAEINKAIKLLEDVWSKVEGKEIEPLFISVAINLGNVYRLLGEDDIAKRYIQTVIKIDPGDPDARMMAALYALDDEDPNEACRHLKEIKKGLSPKTDLMYAETLARAGNYNDALNQLDNIKFKNENEHLKSVQIGLKLRLIYETNGVEAFSAEAENVTQAYPDDSVINISIAKIYYRRGETEEATKIINKIADKLNRNDKYLERFYVAETLFQFEQYAKSQVFYKDLVTSYRDSHLLRRLLICLYNTDQRKSALEILENLSEKARAKKFYRRFSAGIYFRIGEIAKAREESEAYLEIDPDNLGFRLNWITILQKQGDYQAILNFLSNETNYPDANPMHRMRLAHLFHYYEFKERGIILAYELRRAFQRNHEIHMGYMGLLLLETNTEIEMHPKRIDLDVAFSIANDEGELKTFIIEDSLKNHLLPEEIPSSHKIAKAVLGKSEGESITLDTSPLQKETWKIVSIKSKYIYLLHKTAEDYSSLFPEESNFWKVNLKTDSKGKPDFTPIFKSVDDRRSLTLEIEKSYQKNQFPIGVIAGLLGSNPINVWQGFMRLGRTPIKCCVGLVQERSEVLEKLRNCEEGCLVDPLTLFLICTLNIQDEILAAIKKIGITQSTLDLYISYVENLKLRPPAGFIGKEGDKYTFIEFSAEDHQREITHIQEIYNWAQHNCDIIPAVGEHDLQPQWEKLTEMMHPSFIDSILAASGSNKLLLSDDMHLRLLSKQLIDLDGIWLQAAMLFAQERNTLSTDKYSEAVATLIELNFEFITISSSVLMTLSKLDNWSVSERFKKITATLGKENVDLRSALNVTIEFLVAIWQKTPNLDQSQTYTYAMLNSLRAWRDENIIRILLRVSDTLPMGINDIYLSTIEKWCKGHFLPLPH